MNRPAIIQAAYYTCRAWGEQPDVRAVAARIKAASPDGRGFRWAEINAWLDANDPARATLRQRRGNDAATTLERETAAAGNEPGNPHAGDLKVLPRDERPNGSTQTTSAPTRRARDPKPLPEIPRDLRDDVERVIANDAGERKDGKIADSVVERLTAKLRRAARDAARRFPGCEAAAFRRGLGVAIDRGLGMDFAAGCVRRYNPARDETPLFGDRVAPFERPRPAPRVEIPPTADGAVFAELARPGEDFETCSRRLRAENRDGFNRLHRLSKREPISA
ncbi:MAG: hypothetical protein JWM87_683 [Candidatus Eremiobacteraeota bacterium]|nr:hypothetical protein [Candidatus Eremiobacteraeota bacterium]